MTFGAVVTGGVLYLLFVLVVWALLYGYGEGDGMFS